LTPEGHFVIAALAMLSLLGLSRPPLLVLATGFPIAHAMRREQRRGRISRYRQRSDAVATAQHGKQYASTDSPLEIPR
jgi:hypothetical protein